MRREKKIKIKTFSLRYDLREDRMILLLNKNEGAPVQFWITRRFYFSLLFELETFLERLDISPSVIERKYQSKNSVMKKSLSSDGSLLENVNIHYIKEEDF